VPWKQRKCPILFEERSLSQSRWKLTGASNAILVQSPPHDDLREELERRIKLQTVPANAETAAMLFLALLASGKITMCKADGWQSLAGKPSGHILDLAAGPDSIMLPGASSSSSSTVRGGSAKPRQKSIPLGERMVYSRTFSRPGTSYGELHCRGLAPALLPMATRLCVYALVWTL
jgi:hypothetical protein